jgi:signal transduction histidine kinase
MIAKDGSRIPVEVSSRAIYENGVLVGVQGMARDITERKWAQETLQMFSHRLIEAQEDERRRIARELHDQIGQVLTAVKMNLHTVQQVCNSPETRSYVNDNIEAVDQALRLVRDLSVDLRPPVLDDLGLATALRWYVDRYTSRTGLKVDVVIELPDENERFSRELETACFRIAQEALTNVVRHANASQVLVQLSKECNVLLLTIKDDGVGFDLESVRHREPRGATLGLCSMHERAHAAGGTIEIDSKMSQGTELRFSLPVHG